MLRKGGILELEGAAMPEVGVHAPGDCLALAVAAFGGAAVVVAPADAVGVGV